MGVSRAISAGSSSSGGLGKLGKYFSTCFDLTGYLEAVAGLLGVFEAFKGFLEEAAQVVRLGWGQGDGHGVWWLIMK
jgi:hypothetical protein